MMTPIISEVLILLLFAVPSAAWRSSSHHQLQQQLQSRSQYSIGSTCTSSSLLLASSPMVYDDFISREDWQALSQEDRNNIHEQRRLANPDVDSDAPSPTSTATSTVETTTTATIVADISVNAPSNPSPNKDDDGRYQGTVKWFNMRKGFGFVIRDDNKEEVFVHQTSIQSEGFRGLQSGAVVEFEIETIGERTSAVNVTTPGGTRLKEVNKPTVAITVEPTAEMKKESTIPSSSETITEETKAPPVAPALVPVGKQEETKTPASVPVGKKEETKAPPAAPATSPASSRDEDLRLTLQVIMDHAHRSATVSKEELIHQMEESKKKEQSDEIEIEIDTTDNDVSIPYMATAQLAFEQSDKSVSYDEFERKYLADSVQDVIEKRL